MPKLVCGSSNVLAVHLLVNKNLIIVFSAYSAGKGVTLAQVEQTLALFNEYLVHVGYSQATGLCCEACRHVLSVVSALCISGRASCHNAEHKTLLYLST